MALVLCLECFGSRSNPGKDLQFLKPLSLPSEKSLLQLCLEKILNLTFHNARITVVLVVDHLVSQKIDEWLLAHPFKEFEIIMKEYVIGS